MDHHSEYDVVIIGAGQAGVPLSHALASAGKRVALVEREHVGGSCVNFGCTPTKAALTSARIAHLARRAGEYGVRVPLVEVDFAAVIERAAGIAETSRAGIARRFANSGNPVLVPGHGRLAGRDGERFLVTVGDPELSAETVVLDTGTRTLLPPIDGLGDMDFIHSGNWLAHRILPEHVVMVGGGYIGLEMAQFYRRMGSRVTVIERGDRIARNEDEDVSDAIRAFLEREGVEFRMMSSVERVERSDAGVAVHIASDDAVETVEGSHLFLATGRKPNTDDLGLDTVGVRTGGSGIIEVDERLSTTVSGVWAAGDIRGGPMFTHTSWDDYRILESQIVGDGTRTTNRIVPYAVFTDPELGRVGMTEREAREKGKNIKVGKYEMSHNGKASEIGETEGFVKVVIDVDTNLVLGASVLAAHGAELVHAIIDLMNADAPYTVLRDSVQIHPTLMEAIQSTLLSL